jgi:hypothetical protein
MVKEVPVGGGAVNIVARSQGDVDMMAVGP